MRGVTIALAVLAVALSPIVGTTPARAAPDFDSAYVFESAYLANMAPGDTGTFAVFFQNTGALTWTISTATQVNLGTCRLDKVTCGVPPEYFTWNPGSWLSTTAYATQSKSDVTPGDSSSFFYQVKASTSTAPGTYRFNGDLVVAATGALIHPEGYYQEASVTGAPDQEQLRVLEPGGGGYHRVNDRRRSHLDEHGHDAVRRHRDERLLHGRQSRPRVQRRDQARRRVDPRRGRRLRRADHAGRPSGG